MMQNLFARREFTGYHMVAVMTLFFGTIISVNLLMAWYANTSWSGLVVKNSYVASQEFNGKLEEGDSVLCVPVARKHLSGLLWEGGSPGLESSLKDRFHILI